MLMKETTRNRTKIFHICDPYDIATIRALREQEEEVEHPLKRKQTKNMQHEHGFSEEEIDDNPVLKMKNNQVNHALPASL